MPTDESTQDRSALTPEEVGARVSAILEAAERDARAVIDAAHRETRVAQPADHATLERLAAELDGLVARVAALEAIVAAQPAIPAPDNPEPRPHAPADPRSAARVRAIELALAGYSRETIARELSAVMELNDVEGLLDEVLAR